MMILFIDFARVSIWMHYFLRQSFAFAVRSFLREQEGEGGEEGRRGGSEKSLNVRKAPQIDIQS